MAREKAGDKESHARPDPAAFYCDFDAETRQGEHETFAQDRLTDCFEEEARYICGFLFQQVNRSFQHHIWKQNHEKQEQKRKGRCPCGGQAIASEESPFQIRTRESAAVDSHPLPSSEK